MGKANMKTCLHASCGLEVDTVGRVRPCCLAKPFVDDAGKEYNLSNNTLTEIWNSDTRKKLLQDLENGIENSTCEVCWSEEKHGRESKRQRENTRTLQIKETPQILDLKLGNTCNLKCRTCNPEISSSWVTEWYDVNYSHVPKNEFMQKFKKIRQIYSAENTDFWNTLEEWIPQCSVIDFYGGEPLLVEKSWEILDKCVLDGYSYDQEIHFNTNATMYLNTKQETALKNFKKVNISLSIDGIGEKFEYMRYPGKWNTALDVIEKYSNLSKQNDHIRIDFCYTVSIYNIWDIVEFDMFVREHYPNIRIYYNMLFHPTQFSITNIPEEIKLVVSKRLLDYSDKLTNITNMLNTSVHNLQEFEMMLSTTEKHDKYRNNYFKESFEEWHAILTK
jgi:MoaA/NifB/PqqE/SkfB family radical SAM enzyme